MSYSPNAISFLYQQNLNTPSQTAYYFLPIQASAVTNISVLGLPPWAFASNVYFSASENRIYFTLVIQQTYAGSMQPGDYSQSIRIKYTATLTNTQVLTFTAPDYNLFLSVLETVVFNVDPNILSYSFIVGGNDPQNKSVFVTSDRSWSVTASQSWVSLSQTSGLNSGSVSVGVDITGLSVGSYGAQLNFTDGLSTKVVAISLVVTEGESESLFLNANPQSFQFISELGVVNTTIKYLRVDATAAFTLSASETWLVLSESSGAIGLNEIELTVDSDELTNTDTPYLAEIDLVMGSIQKKVFVELIVVPFIFEGISSEGIYYVDDRPKIRASNTAPNTALLLEAIASTNQTNKPYKMRAPYQDGIATLLIGQEANALIKNPSIPESLVTGVWPSIVPMKLSLSFFNQQLLTGDLAYLRAYSNLSLLPGKTPITTKKHCHIPDVIYLTKQAIISMAIFDSFAVEDIEVTGDVTATFSTSISQSYTYQSFRSFLNLSDLDLEVGDTIEVTFGACNFEVVIKPEGLEQTTIAFLNQWKEWEFFECTGSFTNNLRGVSTNTELQEEGVKRTETVDVDSGGKIEINTGWVHTDEEVLWLSKILEAKRIYIIKDGVKTEVVRNFSEIQIYKTRNNLKAYKLTFNNAIVT